MGVEYPRSGSVEPKDKRYLARPERFELPTTWFEARYSIQLSYGRVFKTNELGVGGNSRVAKPRSISITDGVILTAFTG